MPSNSRNIATGDTPSTAPPSNTTPSPAGLLLTHGSSGSADHHTLAALHEQIDIPVHRMEFPYRREGRRFPDRAPKLIASVSEEADAFALRLGTTADRIAIGGRSLGGRMCSMAAAEGLPCAGLVLLSYPLHPPGKPDRLRVEHFERITVPSLFVCGDRDPFGTPEEFAAQTGAIAGKVTVSLAAGTTP